MLSLTMEEKKGNHHLLNSRKQRDVLPESASPRASLKADVPQGSF